MNDAFKFNFQFDNYLKSYGLDKEKLSSDQLDLIKHAFAFGMNTGTSLMSEGQMFVQQGVITLEEFTDGLTKLIKYANEIMDTKPIIDHIDDREKLD